MKLPFLLAVPIIFLLLSSVVISEGYQPFEAGAYPITSRIETIKKIISATELRLSAPDLSPDERALRNNCLIKYSNEKKQLEAEYEEGKRISHLPGIIYLASPVEINCLKGLSIAPSGQPLPAAKAAR